MPPVRLERFDNEDLYGNLDWLSAHRPEIEGRLFQLRPKESASALFLYNVPSSYLEGEHNELRAFGYNRWQTGKRELSLGYCAMACAARPSPGCNWDDFTERSSKARSPRRALRRRKICSGEPALTMCSRCRGGERQAARYP